MNTDVAVIEYFDKGKWTLLAYVGPERTETHLSSSTAEWHIRYIGEENECLQADAAETRVQFAARENRDLSKSLEVMETRAWEAENANHIYTKTLDEYAQTVHRMRKEIAELEAKLQEDTSGKTMVGS